MPYETVGIIPFLTLFDNSSGVPRYCSLMLSIIDLNTVDASGPDIRSFLDPVTGRIEKVSGFALDIRAHWPDVRSIWY
mgnify:CR=1 FL=1